ncbi:hypothetical protein DFH27DRAFT_381464 [Peziza echinospora]|nr:hypothetical protein DFH27DRAFT_381464 [Peziza echinospora]
MFLDMNRTTITLFVFAAVCAMVVSAVPLQSDISTINPHGLRFRDDVGISPRDSSPPPPDLSFLFDAPNPPCGFSTGTTRSSIIPAFGIRLAFYILWVTSLLTYYLLPSHASLAGHIQTVFSVSLLVSLLVGLFTPETKDAPFAGEVWAVFLMFFGSLCFMDDEVRPKEEGSNEGSGVNSEQGETANAAVVPNKAVNFAVAVAAIVKLITMWVWLAVIAWWIYGGITKLHGNGHRTHATETGELVTEKCKSYVSVIVRIDIYDNQLLIYILRVFVSVMIVTFLIIYLFGIYGLYTKRELVLVPKDQKSRFCRVIGGQSLKARLIVNLAFLLPLYVALIECGTYWNTWAPDGKKRESAWELGEMADMLPFFLFSGGLGFVVWSIYMKRRDARESRMMMSVELPPLGGGEQVPEATESTKGLVEGGNEEVQARDASTRAPSRTSVEISRLEVV